MDWEWGRISDPVDREKRPCMLIRLHIVHRCRDWSASLFFACNEVKFSNHENHIWPDIFETGDCSFLVEEL